MMPLRRPNYRWENNIQMYVKEMSSEVAAWIHLARDTDQ
jgi:hypothetical protein